MDFSDDLPWGEGGSGRKQLQYWIDHEEHWTPTGQKTPDREQRYDGIDHAEADFYSYKSDYVYSGSGTIVSEGRTTNWSASGNAHHTQNETYSYGNAGWSTSEKNFGAITSQSSAGMTIYVHEAHATRSEANNYDADWSEPGRTGVNHDSNWYSANDNKFSKDVYIWNEEPASGSGEHTANGGWMGGWENSWSITTSPVTPDPELAGQVQIGSGTASGGSATTGGARSGVGSSFYNQYHLFGTAGAYAPLAGLPADWTDLKTEYSPFIFGGGWENKITSPEGLIPHVVTDTETVEQIVARTDQSARANAQVSSNMQQEAEEEQRRKDEEKRRQQAVASGVSGEATYYETPTQAFLGTLGSGLKRTGKMFAQPFLNIIDAGGMTAETVIRLGGGNWTYHAYSEMGQAAEEGATTAELAVGLKDGLVQSGRDLILREHDRAYYNGDITPEEWSDRQIGSSSLLLGPRGGRALLARGKGALSRATKAAFGTRAPRRAPLGEAKVRPGENGTTYPGEPVYSKYNNWLLNKIPGLRRVEYPNSNYGVRKGLRNEAAVRAHEQADMDLIKNYPQLTHLAARPGYFPGKGIARTIIEFHANLAEHKGNIGKALIGTLKDTTLVTLSIDVAALVVAWISLKNRGER